MYIRGLARWGVTRARSPCCQPAEEVEAIVRLTALPTFDERFVVPPLAREQAIEQTLDPFSHKPAAGFGFREAPKRRF